MGDRNRSSLHPLLCNSADGGRFTGNEKILRMHRVGDSDLGDESASGLHFRPALNGRSDSLGSAAATSTIEPNNAINEPLAVAFGVFL